MGSSAALLVLPVGRYPFLRDSVHFVGSDLHFKGLAAVADYRSMQRLVKILARYRNHILETARYRFPRRVNDAERGIAVLHGFCNHPDSNKVIDLIYRYVLPLEFLID